MDDPLTLDGADIAERLIRVGRLAYAENGEAGLTPTQWMALRYFARANRFSRTVSAFADYHATTRGTASQTIKTLTVNGYLSRQRSESDGRSVRLDLTEKGRGALEADPLSRLIALIEGLPAAAREGLANETRQLADELASALDRPRFGVCSQCRFLDTNERCVEGKPQAQCRCLGQRLERQELERLCVNYLPA